MHWEACWWACAKHYNVCVAGKQPAAIFNHLQRARQMQSKTAKVVIGDKFWDAATSLLSLFSCLSGMKQDEKSHCMIIPWYCIFIALLKKKRINSHL